MTPSDRIATEILQRFSARQAWEYRLVPFEDTTDALLCYGEVGRDYAEALLEFEILNNTAITLHPIEKEELEKLLQQYYRDGNQERAGGAGQPLVAGRGQGFLMDLIAEAFAFYASDIHFEPYEHRCRVRFRVDGKLLEKYVIERHNYAALVNQVKIIANLDISEKRLPQDGRIFFQREDLKFDLRVSCLPTIYGEKIVLRLLTRHIGLLDLNNLGMTPGQIEHYQQAINKPHGLILISGPTGSGKSTTLYATLRQLNKESHNILTIEDPVEYTLEGVNQVQLKEEIGLTFGSALRTFLRQDPDIIMLGEIRDEDTAQMAIRSSLTGHLIFSTIHTNSAWGSVSRIIDMGVHPYLLSNTLVMSVAQRLVRLLCPACKREVALSDRDKQSISEIRELTHAYQSVGCEHCYHTGYKGRKAIYEVIPIDEELMQAIREEQGNIDQEMEKRGIVSLKQSAFRLFQNGETSLEELIPLINS